MSNKYDPPQTRVEAILLNMLGESYKLDPPQTRVELLLQAILEQGGGGGTEPVIKYKGVTTTPLTDGSTTNPVEIDGEEVTVATGDFVAYNGAEFIWNGTSWQELGDLELVAAIMTSLKIVPVLCCCLWGRVPELSPTTNRFDLIDDEAQWMLCIGWLVVMYLTTAYTTAGAHRFESRAMLPSQVAVPVTWVGLGSCSAHRCTPYPIRLFLGDGF